MVNNNEQPTPATSSSEGTCYFSPFSSFWTITSLISTDTMNELMQRGSEAGATPPTEAEVCAQVLKKKKR
ncbi:hypothetical protein MKX03_014441 [Papaver bracteatum]|nr:hypothetical protein MKX03_014441 [Papaver bracteatum]